jgi:AbrB family looped-hinge helix DNA binding protein
METTIDAAGRVVIPKQLRDRHGLVAGTKLDVIETADGIELQVIDGPEPATVVEENGYLVLHAPGLGTTMEETLRVRDELRDRHLPS